MNITSKTFDRYIETLAGDHSAPDATPEERAALRFPTCRRG
jgi:hypothetical protein